MFGRDVCSFVFCIDFDEKQIEDSNNVYADVEQASLTYKGFKVRSTKSIERKIGEIRRQGN